MSYNRIDSRAVEMWNALYSLQMIADVLGVSRAGVKKYLNRNGIDTSKRKWVVVCDHCGVKFEKHRCQIRKNKNNYCTQPCYVKSMDNPEYYINRQCQRNAREVVGACGYYLSADEVVVFKDGDCNNSDPNNLMVFASHSDHMRWHRGDRELVKPLWGWNNGL